MVVKTEIADIFEEEVPLVEIPEEPVPLAEIPEEDVPLAEIPENISRAQAPKTGDAALLWAMASAMSGAALAWLAASGRKCREESV